MVMRKGSCEKTSDFCQFAPFTLFPMPFPRKLFEKALEMQQVSEICWSLEKEFVKTRK